jgi:hypothetical protein
MAENHNQLRVQVFHRVFDAAQIIVCGDIPGDADDKQVAQALVKYQFRRDSGIGTTQNHREWMLSLFEFSTTCQALVGMLLFVARVALITLHKSRKSLIGGY